MTETLAVIVRRHAVGSSAVLRHARELARARGLPAASSLDAIPDALRAEVAAWVETHPLKDDPAPDDPGATVSPMTTKPAAGAAFFDRHEGFVPDRAARKISEATPIRLGSDGRLYRYTNGVFRSDGDHHVQHLVRELLGEKCRRRHADEVIAWFKAGEATITDQPPADIINCTNGLLQWRTGTLKPHTPDVATTIQIPIKWDPAATCPTIEKFLAEIIAADAVDVILEVIGYCLYPRLPFHRAVLFLGTGANGKSKLLSLIRALLGPRNVANVALQAFAENRFAAAELYGRLANLMGDLDARAIRRSDVFKQVTGGDVILAERKYAHPFGFTSFAVSIFSANEAPLASDQTEAWFRRWLIIPFENTFVDGVNADPHLDKKLAQRAELEGLLVRAVHALRNLIARGAFADSPSITAAATSYRSRLDSGLAFVTDECTIDPDAWTPRKAIYTAYRSWCLDGGRIPLSSPSFYEHLTRNHAMLELRKRRGIFGFEGIALNAATDPDEGGKGGKGGNVAISTPHARGADETGTPDAPFTPPPLFDTEVF